MAGVVVGDAVVAAHLLHVGRAVHLGARGVLRRAKRPLHRSHPLVPGQWISNVTNINVSKLKHAGIATTR